MSDQDPITIADRFEAYLLGQLDDAAMDRLENDLRQAPQQADECISVMATLAMVREQFRDQYQQSDELRKDPTLHDFHDLLSELSAMEAAAEAQTVQWVGQVKTVRPIWQQWPIVIPSGIAALLAIAVVLIVALPNSTSTPTHPSIANDLREPSEPGSNGPNGIPSPTNIVATLTGERDAQWGGAASAAPAPGSPLRAGQRLTLTQGFAEITTNRGAVAILEAPATIELTDNDNALRLHDGKLVGICETESSKGFLVRTPHMNITDLGTRFGVVVSHADTTEVHVLAGEVQAARAGKAASRASLDLVAGQSARATADSHAIALIDFTPMPFAAIEAAGGFAGTVWQTYATKLRTDPSLLAYYSFDGGALVNGIAVNTADKTKGRFNAALGDGRAITSPAPTKDRFGRENRALSFDREQAQALYVDDWPRVGQLDALTVSCWVRVDQDHRNWALLVTQWNDSGTDEDGRFNFHLALGDGPGVSERGVDVFGLQAQLSLDGVTHNGPGWQIKHDPPSDSETSSADGWIHVAMTVACGGGPVRLYKNGQEVYVNDARYKPAHLPLIQQPLVIGGKAMHRGIDLAIASRSSTGFFAGEIDDVAIFSRPLAEQEVRELYQAGLPASTDLEANQN